MRASTRIGFFALLAVLLTALLGGCAEQLYDRQLVQPTGADGKECVANCELPKEQCRQRQIAREDECNRYYTPAKADYDLCVRNGASNCTAPDTCLGADMDICDQQYDDCFQACGGRVEKKMRPWWSAPEPASAKG